ncbi:hypothetical protein V7O67_02525 [Methanolobus sp. ZRKC4]|uniref:hypothetical protein n=1 Tax=Methanolobus sp. ZRKC4 TaxID=3125787 RepID=UPI00324852AD
MFKKNVELVIVFLLMIALCTPVASANQTNDSDKYTLDNYGGEVYTPEPMEFGANLNDNSTLENGNSRKYMMFQFYSTPNDEQLELLKEYGVQRVGVAADYTYIVSIPANLTPADLPDESGLRWMGEIPVENKYDRNYGLHVPEWARAEDGNVKLAIHFYEDVSSQDSTNIAQKYSDNFSTPLNGRPWFYRTIINETNITFIASEDAVNKVTYYGSEVVPDGGSDFVDYEVITEENETELVDEQEDGIQETIEDIDESEEKESPGFASTTGILILALIAILMAKDRTD